MYPGRWNVKGEPALYTSTELGTAALELLSHLPKNVEPKGYAVMRINLNLSETCIFSYTVDHASELFLERSGQTRHEVPGNDKYEFPRFSVFREFDSAETGLYRPDDPYRINDPYMPRFAVAVPSAIVPAYNVIFFPHYFRANFGNRLPISVESVEPFEFHPALFPEPAG